MLRGWRVAGVLVALVIGLLAVPAAAMACGEEGGEDTGPLITKAELTPGNLPYTGGTGKIVAKVADDCGIQQVYVEVNSSQGSFVNFEMQPVEGINTNERGYRAEFDIPANFTEEPISYQATVSAEDTNGAYVEAFAGEIEVAGQPQFDEAPYVPEGSVTPKVWGGFGGTSRIGMTAYDNRGVANAFAIVTYPDSSEHEVPLEAVDFARFEAPLTLPANRSPYPVSYAVAVYAEDDIGQQTGIYAGSVTVEPKGTPSPGALSLGPSFIHFRGVPLDGWRTQIVTLRNNGKPGSPPVSGFLRTSDPQFQLPGANLEGLPFSLGPGQEQAIEVGFRPNEKGEQTGQLTVVRDDGRRPKLSVALFGWGSN